MQKRRETVVMSDSRLLTTKVYGVTNTCTMAYAEKTDMHTMSCVRVDSTDPLRPRNCTTMMTASLRAVLTSSNHQHCRVYGSVMEP